MQAVSILPGKRPRFARALLAGLLLAAAVGLLPVAPAVAQQAPPTLTVTPSTDLLDGQSVQVVGTGFLPSTTNFVLMCRPGSTDQTGCDLGTLTTVTSDQAGGFTVQYSVHRFLQYPFLDCATDTCVVGAGDINETRATNVPVQFADVPIPVPHVTISISPYGTLNATTGEAGASASIACDISATVDVAGTVAQPGIQGSFDFAGFQCDPGHPLHAFIPTRDLTGSGVFSLGSAEVSISTTARSNVSPPGSTPEPVTTVGTGTTQLLDYDQIATAIQTALADPANVELRQQFIAAVQARIAQDPVFRAEWIAALNGSG